MMKKIILLVLIFGFLMSCGRKGDLELKESFKVINKEKVIV